MLLDEPGMGFISQVRSPITPQNNFFLVSVLGAPANHILLRCRYPIKSSNRFRHVHLLPCSILGFSWIGWCQVWWSYHNIGGPFFLFIGSLLGCNLNCRNSNPRSWFCWFREIAHGGSVVGPMHRDHGTCREWTWNYIPGYGWVVVDKLVERASWSDRSQAPSSSSSSSARWLQSLIWLRRSRISQLRPAPRLLQWWVDVPCNFETRHWVVHRNFDVCLFWEGSRPRLSSGSHIKKVPSLEGASLLQAMMTCLEAS